MSTKTYKPIQRAVLTLLTLATLHAPRSTLHAQPTAVGYQGLLYDGGKLANGNYDFTFTYYQFPTGGNQLFGPVTNLNVPVANGLFMTNINVTGMAPSNFFGTPLAAHFLEVDVRTNGNTGAFTALTPRQPVTTTPAAIVAGSLSGALPATQLSGTVGNSQLANNSITLNAGTALSGGGTVALGGTTTLNNTGVTSLTSGGGVTVSAASGNVTLGSTATSANTASAIVSRDPSGNFSAGSITLAGPLVLPGTLSSPGLIYAGDATLMCADNNTNFCVGLAAGSPTSSAAATANTAIGYRVLRNNISGFDNTASGWNALANNTIGYQNTVSGVLALYNNTSGAVNTASGGYALYSNTQGGANTAIGFDALRWNSTGGQNTAIGSSALGLNTSGSMNIGLGAGAGDNVTTGNNNIEIYDQGNAADSGVIRIGTQATQTSTYIAGIHGATVTSEAVYVDSFGHLGTMTSSAKYKNDIQRMGSFSDVLYALNPVTFKYKPELDPQGTPQFGLVAEEVENVAPDLVVHDEQGKPYTVRYQAVDAMLLNEFLKEHKKVEAQGGEIQALKLEMEKLRRRVERPAARLSEAPN